MMKLQLGSTTRGRLNCHVLGLMLLLILLVPSVGHAKSKEGFFVGFGLTNVEIGGDFDGTRLVGGGGSVEVLPDLGATTGIKIIVGKQTDSGSVEFNYSRSDHDGNWLGLNRPAVFRSYNLDAKLFVFNEFYRIQPLVAFGVGYNTLTVENGSTGLGKTDDAKFKGLDLRIGGGIEISLHERIALDILGIYRWGKYNAVDGVVDGRLDDHIDGNGLTTSIEAKFIF